MPLIRSRVVYLAGNSTPRGRLETSHDGHVWMPLPIVHDGEERSAVWGTALTAGARLTAAVVLRWALGDVPAPAAVDALLVDLSKRSRDDGWTLDAQDVRQLVRDGAAA